jgi:hypothetical protein
MQLLQVQARQVTHLDVLEVLPQSGDYTTRPNVEYLGTRGRVVPRDWATMKQWSTDTFIIKVYFDSQGTAAWISGFQPLAPPPSTRYPPPLQQIMHYFVDP